MPGADPHLDVLIGADSLLSHRSGVGRMTFEIVQAARRATDIGTIHLLMNGQAKPPEAADHLDDAGPAPGLNWKGKIAGWPGMAPIRLARQALMNRRINALASGNLVYYEPNMIARRVAIPTVITINDLSWHHEPAWHPADRIAWIDRNLQRTLKQARRITALSQFTKDAAVRALGVPPELVTVVPLAPAQAFRPMTAAAAAAVLARFDLQDRAYVLSVSTIEPRKNFARLFAAHQALPAEMRRRVPLVIAGGKGWGDALNASATSAATRRGELLMLGHVSDDDLVVLTARAGVFAYVSLYEGFGLPVIEAMAAGCAVVASATTSIPEVAGHAALLVDPFDEATITAGLLAVLEDPALAERLRSAGMAQAAAFSWDRTVAGLLGCWQAALGRTATATG